MLVKDIMHSPVVTVDADTSLADAYRIMREQHIRHLPVLQQGQLAGIVTDRDLRFATSLLHPSPFPEHARVDRVMVRNPVTATPLDPVEEAARLMRQRQIGCLPVVERDRLVGIVTGTDLLDAIIRLTGMGKPTARLAVMLTDRPGQLARLTALLDARDVNIHSVLTYPSKDNETLIILRVNTLDVRSVADALRAAGFQVVWPPNGKERSIRQA